jgi:hypothetical protein
MAGGYEASLLWFLVVPSNIVKKKKLPKLGA